MTVDKVGTAGNYVRLCYINAKSNGVVPDSNFQAYPDWCVNRL